MENRLILGMRVLFFTAALGLMGTFFLPWLKLDGLSGVDSGATLMALVASPWAAYFFSVEPQQALVLMGAPVAMMAFTIFMLSRYARGKAAPFTTFMVLASALALLLGARGLIAGNLMPYLGLQLAIALSVLLLTHQLAMLAQSKIYQRKKFPKAYRVLSIATGRRPWRMSQGA